MDDAQSDLTYRRFIDEMVVVARRSISSARLADHGHTETTNVPSRKLDPTERARKELCERLSNGDKTVLAQLLCSEREEAVHDVLAFLEWAVATRRLSVEGADGSFADKTPETMHGDYIARLNGWE